MSRKKPRHQYIYIGCEEKFDTIGESHGSFVLPNDGKTYYIFHQREYSRSRKPKVIYAIFQFFGSRSIRINPIEELRKYDLIYCIDTNYSRKAVTTAKKANWFQEKSSFVIEHLFTHSFIPSTQEPEKEAWRDFIIKNNEYPNKIYSLIVDSDLGVLMKINRREEPIIDDFFIPENWQLNYATSDVNDVFIMVRMMRFCDRSNQKFNKGR
jgi:hypothetical protein